MQLHHHFASSFLVDSLHSHGFCWSCQEVHHFERNATLSNSTDIPNSASQLVQYISDNADHNIRTLNGNGTFHSMGMIAAITHGTKKSNQPGAQGEEDIAAIARVPIQFHKEGLGMTSTAVMYEKLHGMKATDPTAQLDILWKTSIMFGSPM